jgi:hypothetical protein
VVEKNTGVGDQVPVKPSLEVVGGGEKSVPVQTGATWVKVGVGKG